MSASTVTDTGPRSQSGSDAIRFGLWFEPKRRTSSDVSNFQWQANEKRTLVLSRFIGNLARRHATEDRRLRRSHVIALAVLLGK